MMSADQPTNRAISEAVKQLSLAARTSKCQSCGCFRDAVEIIGHALRDQKPPLALNDVIANARTCLTERHYDCLGCDVCYPALAINALSEFGVQLAINAGLCSTEQAKERNGWPPLPGNYIVLRYRAPVAVCTLTDRELLDRLTHRPNSKIALIGTLQTENIGIEHVIANVLANPNIRFLLICGADSRQTVGHFPGQSLIQLAEAGLDSRGRIIGAQGKRPFIHNLDRNTVEHFRRIVEPVDLIGTTDVQCIIESIETCMSRYPGPAEPTKLASTVRAVPGYRPKRMVSDPMGYFIIYVDRARGFLSMEHYKNDGVLDTIIEGRTADELYYPAIDRGLISRLDHAAYLGRELTRAERALKSEEDYVQDAAPENTARLPGMKPCDCSSPCAGNTGRPRGSIQ